MFEIEKVFITGKLPDTCAQCHLLSVWKAPISHAGTCLVMPGSVIYETVFMNSKPEECPLVLSDLTI